jgi:flagellar assembly protein FliH
MSAVPVRFTFGLDLGRPDRGPQPRSEAAFAQGVEAARSEGREAGFAEGERSAASKAARQLAAACEALATRAAELVAAEDGRRRAIAAEAVELAAAIAAKLAGGLVARAPEAPLAALLTECLGSLEAAPHLVIRCHPDLAGRLRDIAEARLAAAGFAGRLLIEPDPALRLADGRIEWADGGMARDHDAMMAGIDAAIAAFLAGPAPHKETSP